MTVQPLEQAHVSAEYDSILQLTREASIEINVLDVTHLTASKPYLPARQRMYVSHLPRQTWDETLDACARVADAGYDPIPHIPVRLIESEAQLATVLSDAVRLANVGEVLLIAGDYPSSRGPYAVVADVLRTPVLTSVGIKRVSLAGHPEGHPKVSTSEIRRAEQEKAQLAARARLDATLATQFFFEAQPFIEWVRESRAAGIEARLIAGLAGPAKTSTLFKLAMRCGVGPSIRALGARPSSMMKLLGEQGPEQVLRDLSVARINGAQFDGVHLFSFGGFIRTCEWLHRVAQGAFRLDAGGMKLV